MTPAHYAGLSRIPLTIVGAFFIIQVPTYGRVVGASVVALAIITDILDGVLARRLGTVSTFGALMDVTTDKIFVVPMLFLASRHDTALLWMATIIAMRDFLVMGVRVYAATESVIIPARPLGKVKSIALYPALILVLINSPVATWAMALATLLAVASTIDYVRLARPLLLRGLNPSA